MLVVFASIISQFHSRHGSIAIAVLESAPFMLAAAGLLTITLALVHRSGTDRHCVKCGYQVAPIGPNSERCPECGAMWMQPGGTRVGRFSPKRHMIVIGLACLFPAVSILTLHYVLNVPFVRIAPSWLLIRYIETAPLAKNVAAEWQELTARTLSPADHDALVTSLLNRRRKSQFSLGQAESNWLRAAVLGTGTSPKTLDRYYSEMFEFFLAAPSEVTRNQSFTVGIGAREFAGYDWTPERYVYLSGFFVGDQELPIGRFDSPMPLGFVITAWPTNDHKTWTQKLTTELSITSPGAIQLRVEFWYVVHPPSMPVANIEWNADGTPRLPPTTTWSRRIECTAELLVR